MGMMQWEKDLESLVAETRAMVRRANQKAVERPAPLASPPPSPPQPLPQPPLPQPVAQSFATPMPSRVAPAPVKWTSPAREEIMQRVAGFRALQDKMRRE